MSDPFKKSLLIHGILIPTFFGFLLCLISFIGYSEVNRTYLSQKRIYDEMTQQQNILNQNTSQREILKNELPRLKKYFQAQQMLEATAQIASQCSDEKGVKLGDLKETVNPLHPKSPSHQVKLLGRSAHLLEILGEMQSKFPAIQIDGWSMSVQTDQKILSFQGNLHLVSHP